MDEHDLYGLADEALGSRRPIESIIRRGEQIRRRRMALRGLGTTALAATVLVVGVVAWPDPPADVTVADETGQEYPPGTSNRPYFVGCSGESAMKDLEPGASLPPETTAGLRFLPSWLPEEMAVDPTAEIPQGDGASVLTGQSDSSSVFDCRYSDPALVLRATGGDDTVEAGIKVEGPYVGGMDLEEVTGPGYTWTASGLRGGPAQRTSQALDGVELIAFTWTEPDGAAWWIEGTGVDDTTIRAVADALRLESAPPVGTPAAALPDDALPAGFELAWQAPGLPAVADREKIYWAASFANAACYVVFESGAFEAPAGMRDVAGGGAGTLQVTVRGKPGLVSSYNGGPPTGGTELVWQEGPDATGRVGCNHGIDPEYDPGIAPETLVRIADSLEPVEVDDPRFG